MTGARHDAIVIGGGVSGLVASFYLAKAGKRVALFETRSELGGLCDASAPVARLLYALDPEVAADLKSAHHGLKYALRDIKLVALRSDGNHLVLGRDVHSAVRAIAAHSRTDAEAYPRYRRELFALARAMRFWWWHDAGEASDVERTLVASQRRVLGTLKFAGAASFLSGWFQSEALKALLAFDATADGASLNEPPSALTLLWRAAQEMSGLQGAVSIPRGGMAALAEATAKAAQSAGAEIRAAAPVAKILVGAGRAIGVELSSGERVPAPLVLSSLSRRRTSALAPAGAFGLAQQAGLARSSNIGSAHVLLVLNRAPDFGLGVPPGARAIVGDRLETYIAAHEAARAGRFPDELVFETVVAPTPGAFALSVVVRPLPVMIANGWETARAALAAKVILALSAFDPRLETAIVEAHILTPDDLTQRSGFDIGGSASAERLLASARARILTPIDGLLLCGADAEPVSAVSCRAARLAARYAVARSRSPRMDKAS